MELKEAIEHLEYQVKIMECSECKNEHKQLLEWLKELHSIKNLTKSQLLRDANGVIFTEKYTNYILTKLNTNFIEAQNYIYNNQLILLKDKEYNIYNKRILYPYTYTYSLVKCSREYLPNGEIKYYDIEPIVKLKCDCGDTIATYQKL